MWSPEWVEMLEGVGVQELGGVSKLELVGKLEVVHRHMLFDLQQRRLHQAVAQHKAQHTGDVSHLCSKEKTLGVEVLCVCTSEDERRGCVFMLRLRPTCHGIRRTVIDTARESLIFHFFCIILRLDPCRTRLPLPLDLHSRHTASSDSCLEPPSHALPCRQPRSLLSLSHFPSTSS